MAFTAADLVQIDAAIASGELTIRTNDRLVTYRSMAELKEARALVAGALTAARTGAQTVVRHQLADFSDD